MEDIFLQLLNTPLSAQAILSLVIGSQMPPAVAWVSRYVESPILKSAIIVFSSLVIGFVVCLALGLIDWKNILMSLLLVWLASQFAYAKFWKQGAAKIEAGGKGYDPQHDYERWDGEHP